MRKEEEKRRKKEAKRKEKERLQRVAEEKRLKDPAWQKRVARTIADGVQDYFYLSPPPGTWIAANRQPVKYRVVSGDTLGEIAHRYRVSLYSLRRANGLTTDTIRVGSELLIPTT